MDKVIAFIECTPKKSLKNASIVLTEAGYNIDYYNNHLIVYYKTDEDVSHIEFLMDCCDENCPYREMSCPDKNCHKKIKL